MGLQDSASKTALLLECQRPFDPEIETLAEDVGEGANYGSAWHEGLALRANEELVQPKLLADKWGVTDTEARAALGGHIQSAWKQIEKFMGGENLWGETFVIVGAESSLATKFKNKAAVTRLAKLDLATHSYDLHPGEFGGTSDLLLESDHHLVVWDHKSGNWGDFSDPETPQLLSLALMTRADTVAVFHYPRTSLPAIYAKEVSEEVLADFAKRRRAAMRRIGDGSLRPGPWCKRCPARESCPSQHAELVEEAAALVKAAGNDLSTDRVDVGRFHQMWSSLEKLVQIARQQIKERVALGEIFERPDGKVLTLQESKPYETVSVSSIREAVGEKKLAVEMDRLRKLGAVRTVNPEPRLVAK